VKAKIIERPIGCIERGLDWVIRDQEKEPNLARLVRLLNAKGVRKEITYEDGKVVFHFWRRKKTGWKILGHFEITPIKEGGAR
jgi:hypothetical protein